MSVYSDMERPNLGRSYQVDRFLGKGAEGTVWKAQYCGRDQLGSLTPGTSVAIKLVSREHIRPNEVLLQAQLRHLNIVTLYDVFETEDGLALVLELASYEEYNLKGPSLWDCIKETVERNMEVKVYKTRREHIDGVPQYKLPLSGGEAMCRWIFLQVASALDYCHRHPRGLCNRDVKPANVLIVKFANHADNVQRPVVKLADFGFCRATDMQPAKTRLGTPNYAAPEVILHDTREEGSGGYDGSKADVWSSGVLLYLLATGIEAFKEQNDPEIVQNPQRFGAYQHTIMKRVADGAYINTMAKHIRNCSAELQDLLNGMLQRDPARRLTMLQVLNHPWSRKLDYDIETPSENGSTRYVNCWKILMVHVEKEVKRARDAEGSPDNQESPHGWTLPYPVSDVEKILNDCMNRDSSQ